VRLLPQALQKRPVALAPHVGQTDVVAVKVVDGKGGPVQNPRRTLGTAGAQRG
jgi:hypothetical protein